MARIPRDKLLDELFLAYSQKDHWSIKALRERTQQPEAYLKETLSNIATLHRSGEHNGTWELMSNYKGPGVCLFPLLLLGDELTFCRSKLRTSLLLDPVGKSLMSMQMASRWREKTMMTMMTTRTRTIWRKSHESLTICVCSSLSCLWKYVIRRPLLCTS